MTGFSTTPGRADREEQGGKQRIRAELFADHYSHARLFFRSLTPSEQAHCASSFVFELSKVALAQPPARMVANLRNVDEGLAARVAAGLGIELPKKATAAREPIDLEPSNALSIQKNMKATLAGRAVGVLYADGSDGALITQVKSAVESAGGHVVLIAPKVGGARLADGKQLKADGQLLGTPSQTVDAIAVVLSDAGCKALLNDGAAVQFVMDAFGHLKAIGFNSAAKQLLDKAGVKPDEGVSELDKSGVEKDFVTAAAKRFWDREPTLRMLA
jgi:catalase